MSTAIKIFLVGVALSMGFTLLRPRLRESLRQAVPHPVDPV
ncbi:hypothetical protein [Endosaccharibacter trunci]